ncbi:hypothetical protein, partial [Vibrio parahaemolyticus]|uniref:hypothetical protein n=1 Tax=Vibrio parahaemolyticus TaxID=670 RepID=UPI001C602F95
NLTLRCTRNVHDLALGTVLTPPEESSPPHPVKTPSMDNRRHAVLIFFIELVLYLKWASNIYFY